jgi:predicted outer membrane repeat protein
MQNSAGVHGGGIYSAGLIAIFGESRSTLSINDMSFTSLTLPLFPYLPDAPAKVVECTADHSGGALYALAPTVFADSDGADEEQASVFSSNSALVEGGAVMSWSLIVVGLGHPVAFVNNSAGQDGGAISLDGGASLRIADEECPAKVCDLSLRGDGKCDLQCMSRGCNW